MARKTKKDKRSRITLRTDPKVYERVIKVAKALGNDVNGVINFMLSRWLGQMELETSAYQQLGGADTDDQYEAMEDWLRENPGKTRKQYVMNFIQEMMEDTTVRPHFKLPDDNAPVTTDEVVVVPAGPSHDSDFDDEQDEDDDF